MGNHCVTCECSDGSSIGGFNTRIKALISSGKICLQSPVSQEVVDRLLAYPSYQFGFRDFLPAMESTRIVGMFLCGLKDPERYFGVLVSRPDVAPKPFEYVKGDSFDLSLVPFFAKEDFPLIELPDESLITWMNNYLEALHTFVEKTITGREDGGIGDLPDGWF